MSWAAFIYQRDRAVDHTRGTTPGTVDDRPGRWCPGCDEHRIEAPHENCPVCETTEGEG